MRFRYRNGRLFVSDCRNRLPFRFGQVTMTRAPLALLEVQIETEGGESSVGYSSDLLAPKWFEKDPDKSIEDDFAALANSVWSAMRAAADADVEESAFGLWLRLYRSLVGDRPLDASDRLVRGFGVALVERAVLDAACRAAGLSFFAALDADLFGFRPGALCPELEGWSLSQSLGEPLTSVWVRHTVGLADALSSDDLEPGATDSHDGHPITLEQDIDAYALRYFKIKLGGDRDRDLERLLRVAALVEGKTGGTYRVTLDGNEQYRSLDELRALVRELEAWPQGQRLLERLLFIEQPLPRSVTFNSRLVSGLSSFDGYGGVVLDEADSGPEALERAIELGYRGVSVKNCKGVFRALINRGLCDVRSIGGGRAFFQTGEDLTNLPIVALQQDLATMAALGIDHVERNGHHYFRGLQHLPREEALTAADLHADLYRQAEGSAPVRLRIDQGRLDIGSIDCPGYGYRPEVLVDRPERIEVEGGNWRSARERMLERSRQPPDAGA